MAKLRKECKEYIDSDMNDRLNYHRVVFQYPNIDFESIGIGGVDEQFKDIFRRAFASRTIPPDQFRRLGLKHQKGIILYGPSGTGKTTLAKSLCKILNSHPPIIVNGPELLDKFVGESEKNVRKLFSAAEKEYIEFGDYSRLHVIIFDEFDALGRYRSRVESSSNVGNNVVNQLLAKMDGINGLNNILLIGITNRFDLLDPAILRPGRFGIHLELKLPDKKGRHEILNIHTKDLRANHLISNLISLDAYAELTENYSGAELELLVQEASSYFLSRQIIVDGSIEKITGQITVEDFETALRTITPKFGVDKESIFLPSIIDETEIYKKNRSIILDQFRECKTSSMRTVLIQGPRKSGKTLLADSIIGFLFARKVTPIKLLSLRSEYEKANYIYNTFVDSYKSTTSYIILDDLERLIEYLDIGPRYSSVILQSIIVGLTNRPDSNCKLLVVVTTSNTEMVTGFSLNKIFDVIIDINNS